MKHSIFIKMHRYCLVFCLALILVLIPKTAFASATGSKVIVDNDLIAADGSSVIYDGASYIVGTSAFNNLDDAIDQVETNPDAIILIDQDASSIVYEVDNHLVLNYTTAIDCIGFDSATDTAPTIKPSASFVAGTDNAFCLVSGTSCAINNVIFDLDGEDFLYGICVESGALGIDNVTINNLENTSIPSSQSPTLPFAVNIDVETSPTYSEFKNLIIEDNLASGIQVKNNARLKVLKDDALTNSFGLKYYGCDDSDVDDIGVVAIACESVDIFDSFFYHSSSANTTDEKTTAIYATGDLNVSVEDTQFSKNRFNIVLGTSATDTVSSTVHNCSFEAMDGGKNVVVNTNPSAAHNFSNNWWNTSDWSTIEGLFTKYNGETITYHPFLMDAQGSYLSDVVLKNLTVSSGTLVQTSGSVSAFSSDVFEYDLTLGDSVTSIQFTPYTFDSSSQISFKNGSNDSVSVNSANQVTMSDIPSEDSVVTFTVTNSSSESKIYTINVKRNSSNVSLSDIKIDGVSLLDFDAAKFEYTYYVDQATTSVNVTATAQNAASTISGVGTNLLNDSVNETLILLQVESEDGTATQDYVISVVKNDNTDASLMMIEVDNTDITGFSSLINDYSINVGDSVDTVSVVGIPTQSNATVAYSIKYQNSSTYNTVTNNSSIVLQFGDNIVNIEVTSGSGSKQTYTVNIIKGLISSADLTGIDIDSTPISGFSANQTEYYVQVDESTSSVNVQATPVYSGATVSGDGVINLNDGSNIQYINVSSVDGTASKTYKLEIYKIHDKTALLSNISVDSTTVSNFDKYTTEYIKFMDAGVENINLSATPVDSRSTVTGTGTKALSVGGNSFDITVLSEDGSTTETYNITIYRGFKSDATLSDIKLDDVSIKAFKSDDYDYSFPVPYEKSSLEIWANPSDEYAEVTGLGNKNISVGKNTYKITVTADDDVTTKVYEVEIIRSEKSSSSSSSDSSSDDDDDDSSDDDDDDDSSDDDDDDSSQDDESTSDDDDDSSSDSDEAGQTVIIEDKTLIEKVSLEDTRNVLEGKESILVIDEDAIIRAIKDVVIQDEDPKNAGENELVVKLPKITSIDDNQSASIGITINALNELFEAGVTLKSYLDNFIIDILPKSFEITDVMKNSSGVYVSKSVLKNDEINKQLFDENKEVFYAFDFNLKHKNNQSDTKITDIKKHVHIEIEIDSELSKSFNAYNDINKYELYVFDTVTQSPIEIPFTFDKNEKVIKFDTKSTGKFYFVKDKEVAPNVQKQEQEVKIAVDPEDDSNKTSNSNMVMIIILVTILIFGVILFVLIRKFKVSEEEE